MHLRPSSSLECNLQLRFKHAFRGAFRHSSVRTRTITEKGICVIDRVLDVIVENPVDTKRNLGRSFRRHTRVSKTESELVCVSGHIAYSGRYRQCAQSLKF